jgi:hypothetical protein
MTKLLQYVPILGGAIKRRQAATETQQLRQEVRALQRTTDRLTTHYQLRHPEEPQP